MLYTSVPLERIYSCRTKSVLINSQRNSEIVNENKVDESPSYKNISLKHGSIYAKRDGENYYVDGIYSTDMSDYLNDEYIPGTIIK